MLNIIHSFIRGQLYKYSLYHNYRLSSKYYIALKSDLHCEIIIEPVLNVILQLNKPAGTTILTLSVSDNDSPRNGGPFEFRVVSGNEDVAFSLDQNGELRSNKLFGLDATREYTLEIQVCVRR